MSAAMNEDPNDNVGGDGSGKAGKQPRDDARMAPEYLPDLLAELSAWRTFSSDEILMTAPAQVQDNHLAASKVLSNLQEEDVDPWLGCKIHCIVRKSTKYIVYLDPSLEIRWWWLVRVNEQVVNSVQARVNALEHESAFLLTQKPIRILPWGQPAETERKETARNIRALIAEGMAVALNDGTQEDCDKVLAEAERQIAIIKDQQARPVFAGWFISAVLLIGALTALFYAQGHRWLQGSDLTFVQMWIEASLCGAFGALISAITRTRTLQLEPAAGHRGLFIEAIARALIGGGAGLLVFFALEAGVLQAVLAKDPEILRGLRLFLCIAAGASERILPSLIGKAEGIIESTSSQEPATTPRPVPAAAAADKLAAERAVG